MDKHKAVREVLDLGDEGNSIFSRKKPLSDNTLKRIYAGLVKFVANGDDMFRTQYNGGKKNPEHRAKSLDEPCGTILNNGTHAIVKTSFIKKYFSGRPEGKVISVDGPAGTVCTVDHQALVQAIHLNKYYRTAAPLSINGPAPTITPKDRLSKIHVQFMDQQYGNSLPKSLDEVCGSLTINPKYALVSSAKWIQTTSYGGVAKSLDEPSPPVLASRRHHYLFNPSWFGHTSSIDEPSVTIVARQDKAPISIVSVSTGDVICFVYDDDSETMIKIKYFMVAYGITDIKMRMLKIIELKQIQGFPIDYTLIGTQTDQKKQIGNAVDVNQAKALVSAKIKALNNYYQYKQTA
jgi:DNA (cytosine-5)-methyltransferase 1